MFGARGDPSRCHASARRCRPANVGQGRRRGSPRSGSAAGRCGDPRSGTTSGLVAYLDGEPFGWGAVEPRAPTCACGRRPRPLGRPDGGQGRRGRLGRHLLVTRTGFRGAGSAARRARSGRVRAARGARALQGDPMMMQPGQEVMPVETTSGAAASLPRPAARRSAIDPSRGRDADRLLARRRAAGRVAVRVLNETPRRTR